MIDEPSWSPIDKWIIAQNILSHAIELFASRRYVPSACRKLWTLRGSQANSLPLLRKQAWSAEHNFHGAFHSLVRVGRPTARYDGDLPLTLNRTAAAFISLCGRAQLIYGCSCRRWFAPPQSDAFKALSRLLAEGSSSFWKPCSLRP